jgi:redox-sensitive bicupin YhaK (pirin superfamily)
MSNLEATPAELACRRGEPGARKAQVLAARDVPLGGPRAMRVRRTLPQRGRSLIGAWCFADHYGPESVDGIAGMRVPPHPHIGLQTVTWLIAGNVLHRDSLGSEQMIRPGQLNLMTSGRGIAHAEESPAEHDPQLHGVQLWVALPDRSRQAEPAFEHHAELPRARIGGLDLTVFLGSLAAGRSPATVFTEIVGAELAAGADRAAADLPLRPAFEHAIFVAAGAAEVAGSELRPASLLYLRPGREHVTITAAPGTRLILLGGVPLGEPLLMWWNFVARTPAEIETAAARWTAGGFGAVGGYDGEPMPLPPLTAGRLRPPPGS